MIHYYHSPIILRRSYFIPSATLRPNSVRRYFCFACRGWSGIVLSIKPLSIDGIMYFLEKCPLLSNLSASCNSFRVISFLFLCSAWMTCMVFAWCMVGAWLVLGWCLVGAWLVNLDYLQHFRQFLHLARLSCRARIQPKYTCPLLQRTIILVLKACKKISS